MTIEEKAPFVKKFYEEKLKYDNIIAKLNNKYK
jgi:hypothetical protein